jgi:hypothetical protein
VTDVELPTTFFGVPLALRRRDAHQLVESLSTLWYRQMDTAPGELDTDLDALRVFFDPLARGERLRRLISSLQPAPQTHSRLMREPMVVASKQEILITLEGRVVLGVLLELLDQDIDDPIVINLDSICSFERIVGDRYRKWGMRRIEDVLRLMTGQAEALRISSIAWLLLLLVNGSRSPATALPTRVLSGSTDQEKFEASIRRIIGAFTDVLAPGQRDERHFGIYQGYALTEARRRLPGAIGEGDPYIVENEATRVIALVAAELSRPQRSPDLSDVMAAFDRLVLVYREERPRLALLGVAHERRGETQRIRELLERALENDRGHPGLPS